MPRGGLGAWTRAAGTWAASSTGATGKAHLPHLLLRGPPLQYDASPTLQGHQDGDVQHRDYHAALGSLPCSVCGWLSRRQCCLCALHKQPCIHDGHHVLRGFTFCAGIPLL